MDHNIPRCTVPVEITGKICEFGLRPDRYFSRVPVDIWRLFKTTLRPLPGTDTMFGDDQSGCLGMCVAEFSVLGRNLSDHTVLVSREQIPTVGLNTLMDTRLVYNFGDGTVKLAEDYPRRESPRPRSRPPYPTADDEYQRGDRARGDHPLNEEYAPKGRYYEAEEDLWDKHNMNSSFDRRPNQSIGARSGNRPDFDDNRRPISPGNYKSDFPDDFNTSFRREHLDQEGPSSGQTFDRRPFNQEDRGPQFNDSFRSDNESLNFRGNLDYIEGREERQNRDALERNISEQLSVMRRQASLNVSAAFDVSRRDTLDGFPMKRPVEQVSFSGPFREPRDPTKGNPKANQGPGFKPKPKSTIRCTFCQGFGHTQAECRKKIVKKKAVRCTICRNFGHLAEVCRSAKAKFSASPNKGNNHANAPKSFNTWDTFALGSDTGIPNIQGLNQRAELLQMLGGRAGMGGNWPGIM